MSSNKPFPKVMECILLPLFSCHAVSEGLKCPKTVITVLNKNETRDYLTL